MKLKNIFVLAALTAALVGCDDIKENERFLPVELPDAPETPELPGVSQPKNVLIEDFTGMLCINCPNAAEKVVEIQNYYGADRVIAVAIHGDMPGLSGNLKNDLGTEYYNRWGVESLPRGMVDRKGGLQNYTSWMAIANEQLALQTSSLSLSLEGTTFDPVDRTLKVNVEALCATALTANLQVWITESNIVSFQKMPDGSINRNYVHNHVLRDAVNGSWGEAIALEPEVATEVSYDYTVPAAWVAENLAVVAFAYNDGGVIQVIEKPLSEEHGE